MGHSIRRYLYGHPIAAVGANNSIVCHIDFLTAEQLLELVQLCLLLGEIFRFQIHPLRVLVVILLLPLFQLLAGANLLPDGH